MCTNAKWIGKVPPDAHTEWVAKLKSGHFGIGKPLRRGPPRTASCELRRKSAALFVLHRTAARKPTVRHEALAQSRPVALPSLCRSLKKLYRVYAYA